MNKEHLEKLLFSERLLVFAVLDGASIPGLRDKFFEMRPPHHCLIRGDLEPDMQEVSPYVVGLIPGTPFVDWVLEECFGKHWGIFAQSRRSLKEMRFQFRRLLTVMNEAGDPMIFRFYDPRVLNRFLPTCTPEELETFFGSVDTFFSEDAESQKMLRFRRKEGELETVEFEK
ncbi:MAG: DUF4123 domain-containing protein [Acidobacteria bacterium]|nr:DUF4123 domain-containing protein [Acidobacteriota bacterium]